MAVLDKHIPVLSHIHRDKGNEDKSNTHDLLLCRGWTTITILTIIQPIILTKMKTTLISLLLFTLGMSCWAQQPQQHRRPFRMMQSFETDSPMVHDPVMAYDNGTYYLYSTGINNTICRKYL